MSDRTSDLRPARLAALMRSAIERCQLDLSGRVILTEAASGSYVVTPVLAAMAGAKRVYAVTRSSRYGTVDEVARQTAELARVVEVADRLEMLSAKCREVVSRADIVTNSGHLRPIDAETVGWMKPTAVVPLMYESWEFRPADVDLAACRRRGVLVGGTNERHPAVDVFAFLGPMAVKLLSGAGLELASSRVLVLCDNPFEPYLAAGLASAGARVESSARLAAVPASSRFDAVLVALRPGPAPALTGADVGDLAARWPRACVAQFWGDLDRGALGSAGLRVWPPAPPAPGHMGILPASVGPEPTVRLQAGGLKVGEVLAGSRAGASAESMAFVQPV